MLDLSVCRIELVEATPGSNVDTSPLILSDATGPAGAQSLVGTVDYKVGMLGAGIVDANRPARTHGYPEPAEMVEVKSANKTWRVRLVGNVKRREAAVTIAHEAADIK